jgi:hypothetical protein
MNIMYQTPDGPEVVQFPDYIILGASTYTFVPRNKEWMDEVGCCGRCRWPDMEVDIVTEGQSISEIVNTIIHECLHLCYREWNIKPRCGEERTVTSLGFALTALYSQNPELTAALAALLEHS